MSREFVPGRLDVPGFAAAGATLSASEPILNYERLRNELASSDGGLLVEWRATGELRSAAAGGADPWLRLVARTRVPLTCQRCLKPVDVELAVDRWFRFASDEATAAAEDEASDEDVLVAARDFDLHALIEDELLMEIPITPRHEVCPDPVPLSASDADFDAADVTATNPFAALKALKDQRDD